MRLMGARNGHLQRYCPHLVANAGTHKGLWRAFDRTKGRLSRGPLVRSARKLHHFVRILNRDIMVEGDGGEKSASRRESFVSLFGTIVNFKIGLEARRSSNRSAHTTLPEASGLPPELIEAHCKRSVLYILRPHAVEQNPCVGSDHGKRFNVA